MTRRRARPVFVGAALALAGALALSACAGENSLGGSVSELFPLEVSRVDVLRNEEALQVSYYRNNGPDVDLVIQLTVALKNVNLVPGETLILNGEYDPGHQRATVLHIPAGEPARVFPPVRSGDLQLEQGGEPDQLTEGNFSLSFEQNGDYGSGRTVYGNFKAVAVDAGFGP